MGLIAAGFLTGLGNGTASFGQSTLRAGELEAQQDLKYGTLKAIADERANTARDIAQLRAESRGAGGGGKSGPFMTSLDPGSMAEEAAAGKLGVSVPVLRQIRAGTQSGDDSAFSTPTTVQQDADPENSDQVSRSNQVTTNTVGSDTKGWLAAKRSALADIQQEYLYGSAYDDVAKGRREEQGNKIGAGLLSGKISAPTAGQNIAALDGKGAYKEGGNTMFNEFSGANSPTAVGQSEIGKNNATAAKERDGLGSAAKIPEDAKLELQALAKRQESAESELNKRIAQGGTTDKDGKELPEVTTLKTQVEKFEGAKSLVLARAGIGGRSKAMELVSAVSDPAVLQRAINGANVIGGKYAQEFVPIVQAALEEAKKRPAPAAPAAATPAKPAAASTKPIYTYGLLSAGRLAGLQKIAQTRALTAAEADEMQQLQATKDSAWWRGRATGDDFIQ